MAKRHPLPVFPCDLSKRRNWSSKIFWLLFLRLLPHYYKTSSQFEFIELRPRPSLKIIGFSGQTLIKFKLWYLSHRNDNFKLWSYDLSHAKKNFSDVIDRTYNIRTFISKCFYSKVTWSSHFCKHHQSYNHIY